MSLELIPWVTQPYTLVVVDWLAVIAGGISGGFPQANGVAAIVPLPTPTPCTGGPLDFEIAGAVLVDLFASA